MFTVTIHEIMSPVTSDSGSHSVTPPMLQRYSETVDRLDIQAVKDAVAQKPRGRKPKAAKEAK